MPARRAPIYTRISLWIAVVVVAALIAVAAYEIEANRQHIGLIAIERALQSRNVDNMPFDPNREALVIDAKTGVDLLIHYQLPAIYERENSGAIVSYTITKRADCDGPTTGNVAVANLSDPPLTFCVEKALVAEPANILEVGTAEPFTALDDRAFFPIGPTITFVRNGRRQGTFTAGAVDVLPYVPRLVATCDPTCGLSFVPERIALDALSGPADSRTGDPLPVILGLQPRSAEELSALGWSSTQPAH